MLYYCLIIGLKQRLWVLVRTPRKHRLCHTLEPPRRGGSNEYPQSLFWVNENRSVVLI